MAPRIRLVIAMVVSVVGVVGLSVWDQWRSSRETLEDVAQQQGQLAAAVAGTVRERLADASGAEGAPLLAGSEVLDAVGGLGGAIALAVMVVFMVMTVQFGSLRLPFVMLLTLPGALLGIVLALLAAGQGFSIPALMGALMVIGIAVSNGILLVDQANRELLGGLAPAAAMIAAARIRFTPIAMTSLATIAGLLPSALGLEAGTESNRPLALAVVGGLATSTLLSLFLVPVMFTFIAPRNAETVPAVETVPAGAI